MDWLKLYFALLLLKSEQLINTSSTLMKDVIEMITIVWTSNFEKKNNLFICRDFRIIFSVVTQF